MSPAFEGDGSFQFEVEYYSLLNFIDKCFKDYGSLQLDDRATFRIGVSKTLKYAYVCANCYALLKTKTGSPFNARLNVNDFDTTAKTILAGGTLPDDCYDNLFDKESYTDYYKVVSLIKVIFSQDAFSL